MSLNMLFENVLCFNHAVSHYLSRVSVSGLLTVRPALRPSCLRGVRTLPQVRRRPPPPAGGASRPLPPQASPSTSGERPSRLPGPVPTALPCPGARNGHTAAEATAPRRHPAARGPRACRPPPPCLASWEHSRRRLPITQLVHQEVRWCKARPPLGASQWAGPEDSCRGFRVAAVALALGPVPLEGRVETSA